MTQSLIPFLKSILSVPGLSGYETPVARLIEKQWKPLADEVSLSRVGSLHGFKHGSGKAPRPSILIATHMDAIGLMVTKIVDGFLHITQIGGIDARVLPGTAVTVHSSVTGEELPGVVAMRSANLLPEGVGDGVQSLDYLLVDTSLTAREVERKVRVGDLVSYAYEPIVLAGDVISGHTLDNRVSVAALTVCLEELQNAPHAWDVWAVATAQEEETFLGAYTSAYALRPQIAIVVDVTFAKGPGVSDWRTFQMGKGVPIGMGPEFHPVLHEKLREIGERIAIPYVADVMHGYSATDAYAIQTTREGIPTALLEIPLRYMHTPVESVLIKDIQRVGWLMAEFITSLEPDFIEKIAWE